MNQWPADALPELQPAVEEYAEEMGRISEELTEALCMSLGWERDALQDLFFELDAGKDGASNAKAKKSS